MEHIAIIGIGCRFPGADSPEAFWELLREGRDCIVEVPPDRWDVDAFYDANPATYDKMNTRLGGFVKGVDLFDPQFFKIAPREAANMDPQQRLLLEVTWSALEDAGLVAENLAGSKTGVFIGIGTWDYHTIIMKESIPINSYTNTGISHSVAANRLSYVFDFRGPSISIDTACSASLVAVHLACQSLALEECPVAIAGGVNLMLTPWGTIGMTKLGALSADGRCRAFDARASGYVRGEGAGVVVLKPVSKALADNDPVYAVIRGSAVNQGGRSNGITAPNPKAQEEMLREAYRRAGVSPGQVQYVEAHGTGTLLGDPIELKALGAVLATDRPPEHPCIVGTVKTNIGHLETAAGVAGLIKTALALKHREIPANLHFNEPNPHIPFDKLPLRVQQSMGPWPDWTKPALAGVNSFGFGGSNAHVVLQEAPPVQLVQPQEELLASAHQQARLLPVSAHSPQALQSLARSYRDMLADEETVSGSSLQDICYTASVRRSHLDYRLSATFESRSELVESFDAFLKGEAHPNVSTGRRQAGRRPKLVFVFAGQGGHWFGMGRDLLEHEPAFRETVERCDVAMRPYADWSLVRELTGVDEEKSRLEEVDVVQPALFAVEVALAELWRSRGVKPDVVVGHSLGEIAAAYVAGVLSLEDAVRIVCRRSQLMNRTSGQGAMASVELSTEQTQHELVGYEERLSIAVSNSPTTTVVAGDPVALKEWTDALLGKDIFCRPVKVSVAYHSPQMEPLLSEFVQSLEGLQPRPASIPIYSTVTAANATTLNFDADYWARNMREPVLFSATVQQLLENGFNTFLEMSPHPTHLYSIRQMLDAREQKGTTLPSMRRDEDGRAVSLKSLGALYTLGYQPVWSSLYPLRGRSVRLPAYPWQRERFWFDLGEAQAQAQTEAAARVRGGSSSPGKHPLLGQHVKAAHPAGTHIWEVEIDQRFLPYLADHQLQGAVVLPGTAYVEMVLAAVTEAFGTGSRTLNGIEFHKALFLPENTAQMLQVIFSPAAGNETSFQIFSHQGTRPPHESWTLNVSGKVIYEHDGDEQKAQEKVALGEIQARCMSEVSTKEFYLELREKGLQYGTGFQGIERLWHCDGEALGLLRVPPLIEADIDAYQLHPAVLDACIQVLMAAPHTEAADGTPEGAVYIPVRFDEVRIHSRPGTHLWSHARLRTGKKRRTDFITGDIQLLNEDGQLVAELLGLQCQRLDRHAAEGGIPENLDEWLYEFQWQPLPRAEAAHVAETALPAHRGSWLVFADSRGVGGELAAQLMQQGDVCFVVSPGETYERTDDTHFRINPERPKDVARMIEAALGGQQLACRGVLHMWSLDAATTEELNAATLDAARVVGVTSVLHLVQALASEGWHEAPSLWLVTRGGQPVGRDGNDALAVAQSPLWGFGRTLAQEHPNLWGGLIDLDAGADAAESCAFLREEIQKPDGEDQIAVRQGQRYVARLAPKRESQPQPSSPLKWRADASYLITGGLGDLGLAVARWMVEQGARRLILVGRTPLPPRSQWRDVKEDGARARQVAAVRELEALGASVHLAALDVGDEEQLSSFLKGFREEGWPDIRGVVHSAAVLQDRTLLQMEATTLADVFRPKALGGWLLHRLLADAPLDFFVLFSSVASVLGSAGQANYAAANAFLDALAHQRRAAGQTALSINWGPWADIGLAARPERGGRMAQHGIGSIPPDKGLEALRRMLAAEDSTQLTVLPVNWTQWRESNPAMSESPLLAALVREEAGDSLDSLVPGGKQGLTRDALLKAEPAERPALLEANLCQHVGRLLMLPTSKFDAQQPLDVLGIDSLMALQLKNRIEMELGVVVPVVKLLQGPTIAELVTTILEQMQSAMPSATAVKQPTGEAGKLEGQMPERTRRARPESETGYVAPRYPTEEMLAEMLAGLLGLERVGIDDDFFELQSLSRADDSGQPEASEATLAARIAAEVEQVFQVGIDPEALRAAPTVAGLGVTVIRKQAEQLDEEELRQILAELGELSDEEAQARLAHA